MTGGGLKVRKRGETCSPARVVCRPPSSEPEVYVLFGAALAFLEQHVVVVEGELPPGPARKRIDLAIEVDGTRLAAEFKVRSSGFLRDVQTKGKALLEEVGLIVCWEKDHEPGPSDRWPPICELRALAQEIRETHGVQLVKASETAPPRSRRPGRGRRASAAVLDFEGMVRMASCGGPKWQETVRGLCTLLESLAAERPGLVAIARMTKGWILRAAGEAVFEFGAENQRLSDTNRGLDALRRRGLLSEESIEAYRVLVAAARRAPMSEQVRGVERALRPLLDGIDARKPRGDAAHRGNAEA